MKQTSKGSCHCNTVRFEVDTLISIMFESVTVQYVVEREHCCPFASKGNILVC